MPSVKHFQLPSFIWCVVCKLNHYILVYCLVYCSLYFHGLYVTMWQYTSHCLDHLKLFKYYTQILIVWSKNSSFEHICDWKINSFFIISTVDGFFIKDSKFNIFFRRNCTLFIIWIQVFSHRILMINHQHLNNQLCGSNMAPPGDWEYLLQHAFRDLHMLHRDDLTEFLQSVNVSEFIHELHTAERIRLLLSSKSRIDFTIIAS